MSNRAPLQAHGTHLPQVVSVPKQGELIVCFLTPLDGVMTHYTREGTCPCPGEDRCPAAVHRIRPIYRGYAGVVCHVPGTDQWAPEVLEVSEHLEEVLRGRFLPGEVWALSRKTGKRRARPCVGRYLETRPIDGVFDAWDFHPVVCRMYHTDDICWGALNPVAPRIVVQMRAAPPPAGLQQPATKPAETPPTTEQYRRVRELAARNVFAAESNGKKSE